MSPTTMLAAAMMIVGAFLLNEAQAQEGAGPVRRSRARPLPSLRFESVQKELALTEDQKAKVDALIREFEVANTSLFDETFNGRELGALSDREQDKWFDLVRKLNDDFEPKLKAILKPEQLECLGSP